MSTATPKTLLELAEVYVQTHSLSGNSANVYRRYARLTTDKIGCQDFVQITELDLHRLAACLQEGGKTWQS
mgnify:CR=1 FL=1